MADLNRRSLLGMMAAAPVAAAAKPMEMAHGGMFVADASFAQNLNLRDAHDAIYGPGVGGGGGGKALHTLKINVDTSDLDSALERARELTELTLRNHPRVGGQPRRADDEGPGALSRSGAPAPDLDHPILKAARAC